MDTREETWALLSDVTDRVLAPADDITVVVVVNRKQASLADSDDLRPSIFRIVKPTRF